LPKEEVKVKEKLEEIKSIKGQQSLAVIAESKGEID